MPQPSPRLRHPDGDSAQATFGFGLIGFVASVVGFALMAAGAVLGGPAVALSALGVIWIIGVSIVLSTLNGVCRTAMYLHAVGEHVPAEFDQAQLRSAFA